MKKYALIIAFLAAGLIFIPSHKSLAAEVSGGETISVEKTQKNPIIFSNTARIKSDVKGDLTILAGDVQVDNSVETSAYILSGKANIKSPEIGNRLVILSGQVNVASHVKGDMIVFGGDVIVDSPSIVDGDVFVFGGNVFLKGQVGGAVKSGGGKLMLDGVVIQKDAKLWSDQISISENSRVKGNVEYWAKKENNLPANITASAIKFNEVKSSSAGMGSKAAGSILMLTFFSLLIVWIQRGSFALRLKNTYEKFSLRLLTGFILLFAVPLATLILLVSYVGILSALAFFSIYISAWFLSYAYSTIFLGSVLIKWLTKAKEFKADWVAAVIGSLAVVLISYIPVVGALAAFVLALTGMGMVFAQLTEKK
jgi:cytoskeletal protein CcmA (bactofilin family)